MILRLPELIKAKRYVNINPNRSYSPYERLLMNIWKHVKAKTLKIDISKVKDKGKIYKIVEKLKKGNDI